MANTVTIQTKHGPMEAPTIWAGAHLAVHRPPSRLKPGTFSTEPRHWAITHKASGLAACHSFDGTKDKAIALAKLWESAFGSLDPQNASAWRYGKSWGRDLQIAQYGTAEPEGPVLPDPPTERDVARAIARAISGVDVPEPTEADDAEPAPMEYVPATHRRTGPDGWPEVRWAGAWYPVPSMAEIERFCFDSVAESPDGATVEPDHPESWPSILGLI